MVAIKKNKPGTGKFSKPVQMKQEDYYSSSDDNDEDKDLNENRLSDDSEFDLSDDDIEDPSSASEVEDEDIAGEDDEDIADDDDEDIADGDDDADEEEGSQSNSEQESDADTDSDGQDANDKIEGNESWAKSLAKILKQEKPKNKKSVVLSKAKKTSEILEARDQAKAIGFAIDGEIKEEKPDVAELDEALDAKKKKKTIFSLRLKPTMMDRERERAFKKIATKGVVQLFNAVRTQQMDLVKKLDSAGRLDHKRDAVLNNIDKRKFLDVLMGGPKAKSELVDNPVKDESDMDDEVYNDGLPKNSIWSVLKEDFLSNKKLSHWDKDEEEDEQPNTDQSDDNDDSD